MPQYSAEEAYITSFESIYASNIRPKVEALDLFLKTMSTPYPLTDVAEVLELSPNDLKKIMKVHNISIIEKLDFFTLLANSTSYICKLIQRQWRYAHLDFYTPEVISDIYELNPLKIYAAFDELNISKIESNQLSDVFKRIHVPMYKFSF